MAKNWTQKRIKTTHPRETLAYIKKLQKQIKKMRREIDELKKETDSLGELCVRQVKQLRKLKE